MEDFEFQNKGRILFGEGKRDEFLQGVKALSDKVLVVCGPHFARSGELGEMLTAFEEIGIRTWAIADLHQSTIEQARVAWKLCRDNEIGAVVGVGGATAMDFAKLTAYGACQKEDIWPLIATRAPFMRLMTSLIRPKRRLPQSWAGTSLYWSSQVATPWMPSL